MNTKVPTMLERHIQTFLLSVITAMVIFGCSQIFNLSISMAEVKVTLEQLRESSKTFVTSQYINDRDRITDARFDVIEKRVSKLESRADRRRDEPSP